MRVEPEDRLRDSDDFDVAYRAHCLSRHQVDFRFPFVMQILDQCERSLVVAHSDFAYHVRLRILCKAPQDYRSFAICSNQVLAILGNFHRHN